MCAHILNLSQFWNKLRASHLVNQALQISLLPAQDNKKTLEQRNTETKKQKALCKEPIIE